MDFEKILEYGRRCYDADYIHVEHDGDYAIQREGDVLYLLFQWSNGCGDWKNNFDFPTKPYKDMGTTWRCHRGFLRVWKSIKPYVKDVVMDDTVKSIVVVGYSHGAAIAMLAHEYVWYNRPDIRDNIEGYGFGCPKCYWGFKVKDSLKERWKTFYPIRNENDIVTHVPPVLFGFVHTHQIIKIHGGSRKLVCSTKFKSALKNAFLKISGIGAHYWDRYIRGMQAENESNLN
jgi:hypothetical protein